VEGVELNGVRRVVLEATKHPYEPRRARLSLLDEMAGEDRSEEGWFLAGLAATLFLGSSFQSKSSGTRLATPWC